MSPIEKMLRGADDDAATLGHSMVWTNIGERMAEGLCSGCGRDVRVATSEDSLRERIGLALREACTHDLVMAKPSLQRPTTSSSDRLPVATQS